MASLLFANLIFSTSGQPLLILPLSQYFSGIEKIVDINEALVLCPTTKIIGEVLSFFARYVFNFSVAVLLSRFCRVFMLLKLQKAS
ncbi:hypothetical protein [Labilibaculum euxinus]